VSLLTWSLDFTVVVPLIVKLARRQRTFLRRHSSAYSDLALRLLLGRYASAAHVYHDLKFVFINAQEYNTRSSEIARDAIRMEVCIQTTLDPYVL
jgi:hypothetical protein